MLSRLNECPFSGWSLVAARKSRRDDNSVCSPVVGEKILFLAKVDMQPQYLIFSYSLLPMIQL